MEDGLRRYSYSSLEKEAEVLILVVMEDGLRLILDMRADWFQVLILVVMEDGLRLILKLVTKI